VRKSRGQLLAISARQIDRRLGERKQQLKRRLYGRTRPGTLLKHQIPVKTDAWDVRVPGFTEMDLVSRSGNAARGEFAHSLNVTDLHTTWTETRAVLGKGEATVIQAFESVQAALPFRLLGIDSDNGSEFINEHLGRWCYARDIQWTRSRPYKKNDNAQCEECEFRARRLGGISRFGMASSLAVVGLQAGVRVLKLPPCVLNNIHC
jgi:transposase InsO family protein